MGDEERKEKGKGLKGALKDIASTVGLDGVFDAEKAFRKAIEDYVARRLDGVLRELAEGIAREFGNFLDKVSIGDEINKILENYEIKVEVSVKFKKSRKK